MLHISSQNITLMAQLTEPANSPLHVSTSFVDHWLNGQAVEYNAQMVLVSSMAATPIVSPPPALSVHRTVSHISAHSSDLQAVAQVHLFYWDGTTKFTIVRVTLTPGSTLQYEDGAGWSVINSLGALRGG